MSVNIDDMTGIFPENPKKNWHLSAMSISPSTIFTLEEVHKFTRDVFTNNTRCERTAYHATFRGAQEHMTYALWKKITDLLEEDADFAGDLEEELILPSFVSRIANTGDDTYPLNDRSLRKQMTPCPTGIYKACDIHLNVDWSKTAPSVQNALEGLQMISFDRPSPEGFHRIFTLTFESLHEGILYFEHLHTTLEKTRGISARLKLEIATNFYRKPEHAIVLPIVRKVS